MKGEFYLTKFVDEYLKFLNDNFSENQLENRIEITVPSSDKNNDPMKIYAEENEKEGDIYLTDDEYIIENLISSGCDITTPARRELLQSVANRYNISISKEYELFTYATLETFP